jgi:phage nucleotide-binding protein
MAFKIYHAPEGGFNQKEAKILIYGESGAGKTYFSGKWPNSLFLAADKGVGSVSWPFDYSPMKTWDDLYDAWDYLDQHPTRYEAVVLDSLNEMQAIAMQNVLKEFPKVARPYNSIPGESDYGKQLWDFEQMYRAFVSLPMVVIFTAQVDQKQFSTDAILPQLTGKKTARNLLRFMDVVGYLYLSNEKTDERTMLFKSTQFVTKDRSGTLPAALVAPTPEKIMACFSQRKFVNPEEFSTVEKIQSQP